MNANGNGGSGPLARAERSQELVILKEDRRKLRKEAHNEDVGKDWVLPGKKGVGWGQTGPERMLRLPDRGPGLHPSLATGATVCDLSLSFSCLGVSNYTKNR